MPPQLDARSATAWLLLCFMKMMYMVKQLGIRIVSLQITLVARIVRVSETSTNLDLLVDDGTGTLEAKLYIDNEEEQNVSLQAF